MPSALVAAMAGRPVCDIAELAAAAVDATLALALQRGQDPRGRAQPRLPPPPDQLWAEAAAILAGLPPGSPCRRLDPTRLWAGLLATASLAEALVQRDPALLALPEARALLLGFCLGALRAA
jgi:hypothetical protein